MRITLCVTAGPHKDRRFVFDAHDAFIVGRSKRAHFRLPIKDRHFSRIHFLIELNPPQCRLTDLNSKNGTEINGKQVQSADLRDGDEIKAGDTVLRLTVDTSAPVAEEVPSNVLPEIEQPELGPDIPSTAVVEIVDVPPPKSSPVGQPAQCCICQAPLGQSGSKSPPTCPACQEQIARQPQLIPDYLIVRELGKGGMGVVHLAVRRTDELLVALKTIKPSKQPSKTDLDRFLREARILSKLDHPKIVAYRDAGEAAGLLYFAMDFVPGCNAHQLVRKEGRLPVERAVGLTCQLLEALEYAHARGFVHRDIKPENLLVSAKAGFENVCLADFGLARIYQQSTMSGLTLTGEFGGTLVFMAPEQITNFRHVKPPADQYSAAATLYNLLTSQCVHDFPPRPDLRILMILEEEPVPIQERRAEVPENLARIIHRALAKEPQARFGNVGEMKKALSAFCS